MVDQNEARQVNFFIEQLMQRVRADLPDAGIEFVGWGAHKGYHSKDFLFRIPTTIDTEDGLESSHTYSFIYADVNDCGIGFSSYSPSFESADAVETRLKNNAKFDKSFELPDTFQSAVREGQHDGSRRYVAARVSPDKALDWVLSDIKCVLKDSSDAKNGLGRSADQDQVSYPLTFESV